MRVAQHVAHRAHSEPTTARRWNSSRSRTRSGISRSAEIATRADDRDDDRRRARVRRVVHQLQAAERRQQPEHERGVAHAVDAAAVVVVVDQLRAEREVRDRVGGEAGVEAVQRDDHPERGPAARERGGRTPEHQERGRRERNRREHERAPAAEARARAIAPGADDRIERRVPEPAHREDRADRGRREQEHVGGELQEEELHEEERRAECERGRRVREQRRERKAPGVGHARPYHGAVKHRDGAANAGFRPRVRARAPAAPGSSRRHGRRASRAGAARRRARSASRTPSLRSGCVIGSTRTVALPRSCTASFT